MNEEAIFAEARRKPSLAEREEFLGRACGDDADLRGRVEALLEADRAHDSLLDGSFWPQGETVDFATSLEKPGDEIGDYKLLQKIGEGGFGVVFMAEQQRPLSRRVALKVIKPGMDSRQVVARFEAERQALAMMDHPNVAKVHGAGTTAAGRPYFVMELVKGVPITRFCDQQRLSPADRLQLFVPVCNAVQHAHQKGIIHRDLKPSNILVSLYDGRPVPKVIDFGVAKAVQHRLTERTLFTEFGQVVGTLEYMSPEQAELNQLDVDTRTDIYSLGAVLYELLTGATPLDSKRLRSAAFDEMLRMIREEEPARPSIRLSGSQELASISAQRQLEPAKLSRLVRGELDWIVMKALEKQRSRRYETANALALDIQRYLADEPVEAGPPSRTYRLRKFVHKQWHVLSIAAAFLLLLVSGAAISVWFGRQAQRDSEAAWIAQQEEQRQTALAKSAEGRARASESQVRAEAAARLDDLVESTVSQGMRHMDNRDFSSAALYFARALELNKDIPQRAKKHRIRCLSALRECPEPTRVWNAGLRGRRMKLSDDGTLLVTYDAQDNFSLGAGEARIWRLPQGKQLAVLAHESSVVDVAISPDSQHVATASHDGVARIWGADTGEPASPPLRHETRLACIAFDHLGKRIVTATSPGWAQASPVANHAVKLWQAPGGEPIGVLDFDEGVPHATFSPDGSRLATGCSRSGLVKIWDLQTGQLAVPPLQHSGTSGRSLFEVHSLRFSQDGKRLLTTANSADFGGRTWFWDAETGKPLRPSLPGGLVDVCRHENIILTGIPRSAIVWDLGESPPLSFPLQVFGWPGGFSFGPDGRFVLTVSGNVVRFWDNDGYAEELTPLNHSASVLNADFLPNGREVVTLDSGGLVRIWDLACVIPSGPLRELADKPLFPQVVFSPSRRLVSVREGAARGEQGIRIYNVQSGAQVGPTFKSPAARELFSPDERLIVFYDIWKGGDSFSVEIREVASGSLLHTLSFIRPAMAPQAVFSPDGQYLAITGPGNCVSLLDVRTGKQACPVLEHDLPILHVEFSHDGTMLATGSGTPPNNLLFGVETAGAARVWSVPDSAPVGSSLKLDGSVTWVEFSPDNRRLVTATSHPNPEYSVAQVWDVKTGERTMPPLKHSARVAQAIFLDDGRKIATLWTTYGGGSDDGWARIWDAESGAPLTPALHPAGPFQRIGGHKDLLVTGSTLWDTTSGSPLHRMPPGRSDFTNARTVSHDGKQLIQVSSLGIRLQPLDDDALSHLDLARAARVLAGKTLTPSLGEDSLSADQYVADWNALFEAEKLVRAATESQKKIWRQWVAGWQGGRAFGFSDSFNGERSLFHASRCLELLDETDPKSLATKGDMHYCRGLVYARRKAWDQAVDELTLASQLSERQSARQLLGFVYFEAGRMEEHQRFCLALVQRHDQKPSWDLASQLAGASVLSRDPDFGWQEIIKIMELYRDKWQGTEESDWRRLYGALQYRAGNYDQAVEQLNLVAKQFKLWGQVYSSELSGQNYAFRAMAHFKQGHAAQAAEDLKRARQWLAVETEKALWKTWRERREAAIFIQEAEALLAKADLE